MEEEEFSSRDTVPGTTAPLLVLRERGLSNGISSPGFTWHTAGISRHRFSQGTW